MTNCGEQIKKIIENILEIINKFKNKKGIIKGLPSAELVQRLADIDFHESGLTQEIKMLENKIARIEKEFAEINIKNTTEHNLRNADLAQLCKQNEELVAVNTILKDRMPLPVKEKEELKKLRAIRQIFESAQPELSRLATRAAALENKLKAAEIEIAALRKVAAGQFKAIDVKE